MNMCDGSRDIVFNTSIQDNDESFGVSGHMNNAFIEFLNVSSLVIFAFMVCMEKQKTTRKNIN